MILGTVTGSLWATKKCEALRNNLKTVPAGAEESASYYRNVIVAGMEQVRADADLLEQITDKSYWPYPTYSDLLFY